MSDSKRDPNLIEKLDVINDWFEEAANGYTYLHAEVKVHNVADFFVRKGLI